MAPRARNKFGDPMFEPKMFRKQMCCTEGSTCDIVVTFRLLPSDSASGTLCPVLCVPKGGEGGEGFGGCVG